ncbi:MCE family protein [Mycobacterium sp. 050128]|uniref:MCE family protein n=1 Tax=Mycobacterium TaxID=1763 RepID=UPI0006CA7105|nr:MCE family protein [Mycobacterium intracellulare]ARV80147.1 MCE-family protein MCE3A [Mycobacterium intracellulare subsp. chimaera]ASL18774.1 virulence factor Mce family protein [Mycobacterium intracellulare subsp. chimaera]KPN48883.1 MCE-family protein MCE3A [Mycobacterium intracellulare subsp. chimaera]KPN48983.1 MCE-family protein MCE3A [Mycobacterium intracellulare subsp. chimaera]MDM3909145.1 MCE family protein [Mycobacterium intracellulare subsp. chimaera]
MSAKQGTRRIPSEVWAVLLIAVIVVAVLVSLGSFTRAFTPIVPVTLISDRSGLVLEPNARVKLRGVQVGRVSTIKRGADRVDIKLAIDPSQISYIPANVEARIQSTSLFGSKFIDLVYPSDPSPQRLSAGAVLKSRNVGVEVNTVFQNVVELIKQIDPFKLNAVLAALAEGVRGQGERIGEAITASNEVLLALNSRSDTIRGDVRALKSVSDAYSTAAHNILDTLDAATTTSVTVTTHSKQLDALLLNVASVSRSGIGLLGPSKDNLVKSAKLLEPTANLLMKYNPELTCLFVGAKVTLDTGYADMLGGNGRSLLMDAQLLPGYDAYRYPDNLPIDAAKGGPGGKPGCGSLPDVGKNFPVRMLIANTGFGTGLDWRPNPGIGFPGYADYLPATRAVPQQPSIRHPGGPAPGPVPYPGAPPYGAPQYGPDGTPLYPGVPPPQSGPTPP